MCVDCSRFGDSISLSVTNECVYVKQIVRITVHNALATMAPLIHIILDTCVEIKLAIS